MARLLPSRQTTPDTCGRAWNIDPAHDHDWTVLDDVPTPTDLKIPRPGMKTSSCVYGSKPVLSSPWSGHSGPRSRGAAWVTVRFNRTGPHRTAGHRTCPGPG